MKNKEPLVPKTANTLNKICKLERDNISTHNSWMLLDDKEKLTIVNQKKGEDVTGTVTLTFKGFERFIKFYETGK